MKLLFNEYVETTQGPLHADASIISRSALAHREDRCSQIYCSSYPKPSGDVYNQASMVYFS